MTNNITELRASFYESFYLVAFYNQACKNVPLLYIVIDVKQNALLTVYNQVLISNSLI